MFQRFSLYAVCTVLAATSPIVSAESSSLRSYALPNHGSFQINVPRSWHEEIRRPPDNLPPTIVFTPRSGSAFQILITPLYTMKGDIQPFIDGVKPEVAHALEVAKSTALEKDVAIEELAGMSASGYYFSVTDKAPKPNEYKFMTQGVLRVGSLAPIFTILTNDDTKSIAEDGLAVMKSAVHLQNAP